MRMSIFCLALLGLILVIPAAGAQGPKLAWTALEKKEPFYVEYSMTLTQDLTFDGQKSSQRQKQTYWFQWTPKGKKDGKYEVVQNIIDLKMEIDIGGNKLPAFRWGNAPAENSLTKLLSALIGTELSFLINDESMKVEKVRGINRLLKRLAKENPDMKPLFQTILTQTNSLQLTESILRHLPPGGIVPKNKQWTITRPTDHGPAGGLISKNTYKYTGQKGSLHYFTIHSDITFVPPNNNSDMLIIFPVKWQTKGSGEMVFDVKKGRLQSLTTEVHLSGRMTVTINKKVHQTELVQSHRTEIRVMDRDPLEMKEKGPQE